MNKPFVASEQSALVGESIDVATRFPGECILEELAASRSVKGLLGGTPRHPHELALPPLTYTGEITAAIARPVARAARSSPIILAVMLFGSIPLGCGDQESTKKKQPAGTTAGNTQGLQQETTTPSPTSKENARPKYEQLRNTAAYQGLIEDALPYYQDSTAQLRATRKLAELERQRPVEKATWKNMLAGEFESDASFRKRQETVRREEDALNARELKVWHDQADKLKAEKDAAANRQIVLPKLSVCRKQFGVPSVYLRCRVPASQLPYFDRKSMSFEGVTLDPPAHECELRGDNTVLGRFSFGEDWKQAQIVFQDLDEARQFKEAMSKGDVSIGLTMTPVFLGWEDPIVVQAHSREIVFDKEAIVRNALLGLFVAAVNPDALPMIEPENVFKEVERPARVREGVRLHFAMVVKDIVGLDAAGQPRANIRVNRVSPSSPIATVNSMGMKFVRVPAGNTCPSGEPRGCQSEGQPAAE